MNENAIVKQDNILNTDIVEIPANDSWNDDIVQIEQKQVNFSKN